MTHGELESAEGGIAHNYEDDDALVDHHPGLGRLVSSPLWVVALGGPPAAYFGLLALLAIRRRREADPATVAAHAALHELAALTPSVEAGFASSLLEKLRAYLRARLDLPPGALTFADVEGPLRARGVDADTRQDLRQVFAVCEAARYAGGAVSGLTPAELQSKALESGRAVERTLGGAR
ncbi:MAG: hypothetical protein R2748_15725 [Bryobacterales bacterium]